MIPGRKHAALLAATTLSLGVGGIGAAAAQPAPVTGPVAAPTKKPTLDEVKARVDALYTQAEKASEQLDRAGSQLSGAHARLKALRTDLATQRRTVGALRTQVAQAAVAQYQGQGLSTATQVVFAPDPNQFLDNLTAVSSFNDQRAQVVSHYAVALKSLSLRQQATSRQIAGLKALRTKMQHAKSEIDARSAKAKQLLGTLEAQQRAAVAGPSVSAAPAAASGSAATAISYAMAQVGKAYVWGGTGPDGYDCSGLTMMAWQQAGVSLSHSAAAQQASGTPVSLSALQPGDLVFYGSPAYHVAMYIGNGQVVNAENPSAGIRVDSVDFMSPSGATRIG